MRTLLAAVVVAVVVGLAGPPAGHAAKAPAVEGDAVACEKMGVPSPERDATGLEEIGPSAARPTFDVGIGSGSTARDQASLPPRTGARFKPDGEVNAEVVDTPRSADRQLGGEVRTSAAFNATRTRVIVYACLSGVNHWHAGRYEGNVLVYGPGLVDFAYPLVVTTKWPAWVPLVLLAGIVISFFLIAIVTESFVYQSDNGVGNVLGTVVAVLFVVAAVFPVYWSAYVKNATWGANPAADVTALVTAALTAATAGQAAAQRMLRREERELPHDDDPSGSVQRSDRTPVTLGG